MHLFRRPNATQGDCANGRIDSETNLAQPETIAERDELCGTVSVEIIGGTGVSPAIATSFAAALLSGLRKLGI